MNGLRAKIDKRAGLAAFALSAVVFAGLSLGSIHSSVLVPIVEKFVPEGSHIAQADIRWVNSNSVHKVLPSAVGGYARTNLFPGQVLSPTEVEGSGVGQSVVVAVAPTDAIDTGVAGVGNQVEVLVLGKTGRVLWQSPPVSVVSNSSSGSTVAAGLDVAMTMHEALAYERLRTSGIIELVGISS